MKIRSASAVIVLFGIGHCNCASASPRTSASAPAAKSRKIGVKSANVRPKVPRMTRACCAMPLFSGPTTRRRPRTSVTLRKSESARAMKNNGPAFIGATMRRSILCANGASPSLARPIQFDAMKPKSMSSASSRLAFSTLAWADVETATGARLRSSTVLSA
jgi:hypothetical protein